MKKLAIALAFWDNNTDGNGYMADYPDVEHWKKAYRKISAAMKTIMKRQGLTDIKLSRGHKSLSGFATATSGKILYISLSADFDSTSFLIRTASDYKDYTGGHNNYLSSSTFEDDIESFIENNL